MDREPGRSGGVIEARSQPTSGPAGTPVTIHLKGVGWTEYDNIYVATYDNAYMGYACGFNSQGDVVINFTAAGEPGEEVDDARVADGERAPFGLDPELAQQRGGLDVARRGEALLDHVLAAPA